MVAGRAFAKSIWERILKDPEEVRSEARKQKDYRSKKSGRIVGKPCRQMRQKQAAGLCSQHAQDLHKTKPDKNPGADRGRSHKIPPQLRSH